MSACWLVLHVLVGGSPWITKSPWNGPWNTESCPSGLWGAVGWLLKWVCSSRFAVAVSALLQTSTKACRAAGFTHFREISRESPVKGKKPSVFSVLCPFDSYLKTLKLLCLWSNLEENCQRWSHVNWNRQLWLRFKSCFFSKIGGSGRITAFFFKIRDYGIIKRN